jgi:hypothetical protein
MAPSRLFLLYRQLPILADSVEKLCFWQQWKILSLYDEFCSYRYEGLFETPEFSAEILTSPCT